MKKKRQCAVGIQVWGPGDVMLHQNEVHGELREKLFTELASLLISYRGSKKFCNEKSENVIDWA